MHRNRTAFLSPPPPHPAERERIRTDSGGGGGFGWPLVQVFIQQVFIEGLTYARLWPGPSRGPNHYVPLSDTLQSTGGWIYSQHLLNI